MCSTNRGYRCYFPGCGISALAEHREHNQPVLYGVKIRLQEHSGLIENRAILCAAHLTTLQAEGISCKPLPLDLFLSEERDRFAYNFMVERFEKEMNRGLLHHLQKVTRKLQSQRRANVHSGPTALRKTA